MRKNCETYIAHALKRVSTNHPETITEVEQLHQEHDGLVTDMILTSSVYQAKWILSKTDIFFHYQRSGGYFSSWNKRNAIKVCNG